MTAHRLYRVSRSTIDDWQRLRQQTGSVVPLARRAWCKGRVLSGPVFAEFAHRHTSSHIVTHRHRGLKLDQMTLLWQQEQGQKWSEMSFSRALRRAGNVAPKGWTRKKRVGVTENAATTNELPI